jgi:hypothetical protein
MIEEFSKFLIDIKPYIIEKYNECAADPNYEPEPHSDGPYIIDKDQLILQHIKITPEGFEFCLQTFNSDAEVQGTFYITIEDPEVYKNSNKYNL